MFRTRIVVALLLTGFFSDSWIHHCFADEMVINHHEAAGISGFRKHWDLPIIMSPDAPLGEEDKGPFGKGVRIDWNQAIRGQPVPLSFDAVHRQMLLRFPDAAERIVSELRKGNTIKRLELVLPHRATELWPVDYEEPSGMSFLGNKWATTPVNWSAEAWILRRPWKSDSRIGPTFNAYIHGAGYWSRFGAQDLNQDRFPTMFGPAEVSESNPNGVIDLTALVEDPQYGATLLERLRLLSDCGVILRKHEAYDMAMFTGGYEWGTNTGGRAIIVDRPKLRVTFQPGPAIEDELPSATDIQKLSELLRAGGGDGVPTATIPSANTLLEYGNRKGFSRPDWMEPWQWERVKELHAAGGAWTFPDQPAEFERWIDMLLSFPPRSWLAWDTADYLQKYMLHRDVLPAPVLEHWRRFWRAWMVEHVPADQLMHPWTQSKEIIEWVRQTGDWRGNTSFYRIYSMSMGTMNFNHTAIAGALIGGKIANVPVAIKEGRRGLVELPLRIWTFKDGSGQESIDHYYFALTLKDQKLFADFGPRNIDRLMGRFMLAKHVEELAGAYHPNLRRMVYPAGRTGIAYLLGIQDGVQHILHTMSRSGALTDLGKPVGARGIPTFGTDAKPGLIAEQTLNGPWAPSFMNRYVDDKQLPFEMVNSYTMWGNMANPPIQRRTYLGQHYGLASQDIAIQNETVPVMAQWRRSEEKVSTPGDLGTLLVRYGINRTNLLDTLYHGTKNRNPNGSVNTFGACTMSVQAKNRIVVLHSPLRGLRYPTTPEFEHVFSLQTTIGLLDVRDQHSFEVFLNGQPVDTFPAAATSADRITIRDGVTYIGVIPLPSTDLGRDVEVLITDQTGPEVELQGGGHLRPALLIEQYNFRSHVPMPRERVSSDEVDYA